MNDNSGMNFFGGFIIEDYGDSPDRQIMLRHGISPQKKGKDKALPPVKYLLTA